MASESGWYPDPGGQPGLFRWWTGSEWTAAVTYDPKVTPPPAPGFGASNAGQSSTAPTGSNPAGNSSFTPPEAAYQGRRGGAARWWIVGGALVIVMALVVVFAAGSIQKLLPNLNPAGGSYSPDICPSTADTPTASPSPARAGWISSGRLAFPEMAGEWTIAYDNRVPWGSLAMEQLIVVQQDFAGSGTSWVASALVSDLYVGDGFASTKDAAETVLKCVIGIYYSDTEVTQTEITSEKHNVDGNSGWLIETQLNFDIPGLETKGERVLLLVVQTGPAQYGLFYASIPDTRSDLMPQVRQAMANLEVVS